MYPLYHRGLFGNRLRTWDNLFDIIDSGYRGTISLRYRGANAGMFTAYNVPVGEWDNVIAPMIKQGADINLFTANESAPDERLTIQGEVCRTPELGLTLRYSTEKVKMRVAMENPLYCHGLRAKFLLQQYMTPSDYDDLNELLDEYDNGDVHRTTVEFSAYDHELGDCPHRKTIFWEVRHY
jgi:hypothetical protein